MKELLEAGDHFGHQTRRWNPKMKRFIYGGRNGIYIVDLHQTLRRLEEAYHFVRELAAAGGKVLFVGTKKQAQEAVYEAANRCGMYHVNQRWLGGMLTNFRTIRERVNRMRELRTMEQDGTMERLPKKEAAQLVEERAKLEKVLSGIENMDTLPAVVFIVDLKKERIALLESRRLEIPVVAIVDTNCDPDEVDWVIPGNDDAIRAIKLVCTKIADSVIEGQQQYQSQVAKTEAEALEDGRQPVMVAAEFERVVPVEGEPKSAEETAGAAGELRFDEEESLDDDMAEKLIDDDLAEEFLDEPEEIERP